jgi:uncharacterized membrane protein YdcZ (DUF606 family)
LVDVDGRLARSILSVGVDSTYVPVGAATTIGFYLAGQVAASIVTDHSGLIGGPGTPGESPTVRRGRADSHQGCACAEVLT